MIFKTHSDVFNVNVSNGVFTKNSMKLKIFWIEKLVMIISVLLNSHGWWISGVSIGIDNSYRNFSTIK